MRFLLVILIALAIGAGAYYRNEITVWYQALTQGEQTHATPPGELPSIAPNATVLDMDLLEDPLPLVFSETLDEATIQKHMKAGAVVLPLGTAIGDSGNVVITAHSTGTTSFGPYRFAFAKLSELEVGQEFTVTTPEATYTYQVFGTDIVWPHEVDKLPNDERSTITLVTCYPLWTNFKRWLTHGELINVEYHAHASPHTSSG